MSDPMYGHWTPQRCIDAIQDYTHQYGRTPSARDFNPAMARSQGRPDISDRFYDDACWPHVNTLLYVFGSFNAAISAAGFEPRGIGKRGSTSDYAREHLLPFSKNRILQTHCKRGHEFTPENTITTPTQRLCKACHRVRSAATYQRRKARQAQDAPSS